MTDREQLAAVLKEVLFDSSPNGWALLQRVPLICNDIRSIRNDLKWMKYLGGGFLAVAGLLAAKSLGV